MQISSVLRQPKTLVLFLNLSLGVGNLGYCNSFILKDLTLVELCAQRKQRASSQTPGIGSLPQQKNKKGFDFFTSLQRQTHLQPTAEELLRMNPQWNNYRLTQEPGDALLVINNATSE